MKAIKQVTSVTAYETLAAMSVSGLKATCKAYGISGYSKYRKAELINIIRRHEEVELEYQQIRLQEEQEEQEHRAIIAALPEMITSGLAYIIAVTTHMWRQAAHDWYAVTDYTAVLVESWVDMDMWMHEQAETLQYCYGDTEMGYQRHLLTTDEAIAALEDEHIVEYISISKARRIEMLPLLPAAAIDTTEQPKAKDEAKAETTEHEGMTEYLVTYGYDGVSSTNIAWAVNEEDVRRHYGPILSTCELASTCSWAHDKKYPVVVCEHWSTEAEETTEAKSAAEMLDETITEHSGKTNHDMVLAYEQSMRKAIARIVASNITIDGIDDLYGERGDLREAVISARNILRICKADEAIAEQAVRDFVAQATNTTDQQVAADAVRQPSKSVKATEQQAEEMIISEQEAETTTETTTEATEQPSSAAVIAAIILAVASIAERIAGIALTGSPKQVAWATDIRDGWLNMITQTLRSALSDAIAERDVRQAAYACEASGKCLAALAGCTTARAIIDARYAQDVYDLQFKALGKADEDVRQTLLNAAKNATEADIAAVLDQPKSEADILAEMLEAAGGKRWTKGTLDRVYVDITLLGATIEHYRTGNVKNATWCGEPVSNADGRRLETTKVYIDLANDGELVVETCFEEGYGEPSVEEQAKAWYDRAVKPTDPTDPEPTTTDNGEADTTDEAEADEMIISDTTTDEGSDCYFTTDELAALEAAGFRRWQRDNLDRLYYSGDCFEAGIYALYSDAEAKAYVDATDGELVVEATPRAITDHILGHVGRIYHDAINSVRAEASTELAAAIAATISGTADHRQVSLWLDASDRHALSFWERSAWSVSLAASEGYDVAAEIVDNARRTYDVICGLWTATEPSSVLYDELHAEVHEMHLWLDAIESIDGEADLTDTEAVIRAMHGEEPTDPDDDPTTTDVIGWVDHDGDTLDVLATGNGTYHITAEDDWRQVLDTIHAESDEEAIASAAKAFDACGFLALDGEQMSYLTEADFDRHTIAYDEMAEVLRGLKLDGASTLRAHLMRNSVVYFVTQIRDATQDEAKRDRLHTTMSAVTCAIDHLIATTTTDKPATSSHDHASDRTNIASRILGLWGDFDHASYATCCADNGTEEVRFELEHDPAQMLGLLNDIIEDGTTEQATRALAIIGAIDRLDGDKAEEINHDANHDHDKKENTMNDPDNDETTHIGYYAEVNLTLAYDERGRYATETRVDRTGWPDRGEWFDTLEEAEAFMRSEFTDMAAELEDGYRITRVTSRLDSVEYVVGTIERDELDEDDNPIENGEIVDEMDSRPDYVIDAMDKVKYYEELADRIAQEYGEGWKIVTYYDDDHYYTSQEQMDDEIRRCGYTVVRTADATEGLATIHIAYCD